MLCHNCLDCLINLFTLKKKKKNKIEDLNEIVIVKNNNTVERINPFYNRETNLTSSSEEVIYDRNRTQPIYTKNKILKRKIKKKNNPRKKPIINIRKNKISGINYNNQVDKNLEETNIDKEYYQYNKCKKLKKTKNINKKIEKEKKNKDNEEIGDREEVKDIEELEDNKDYLLVESVEEEKIKEELQEELQEEIEKVKNEILENDWDFVEDE